MKKSLLLLATLAFYCSANAKEVKPNCDNFYRCCTQTASSTGPDGFTFTSTVQRCHQSSTQESALQLACDWALKDAKANVEAAKKSYGFN